MSIRDFSSQTRWRVKARDLPAVTREVYPMTTTGAYLLSCMETAQNDLLMERFTLAHAPFNRVEPHTSSISV